MMENKNLLFAIVVSAAILFGWQYFYEGPRLEKQHALLEQQRLEEEARQKAAGGTPAASGDSTAPQSTFRAPSSGLGPNLSAAGLSVGATASETREAALAKTPRVKIQSDRIDGSISLIGGRVDDIVLLDYRETLDPESSNIILLQPTQVAQPYYAEFGWIGRDVKLPKGETLWTANSAVLTPETPVTLSWDNGEGLIFELTYSLDDNYMISLTQRVKNRSGANHTLTPYGLLSRTGTPDILGFYILHEGLIGVQNEILEEVDYEDILDGKPVEYTSTGGWIGITDKYWLAALIPDQKESTKSRFVAGKRGTSDLYQSDYLAQPRTAPNGGAATYTTHLFAGAKQVKLLDKYQSELAIPAFDKAVDFGWFYWLTKPIFYAINWLNQYLGNFGLAILALTVGIKLAFFPLANKSYKSMSKMKLLQPRMVELRDKYGEDKQRLNQEMMALYKKEGANPAAGCLPILIQIPVFFALYKVLFVNIEMRQAPFYGWIHDLSAPDPLGILTLFGLIPWEVPAGFLTYLNLGVWPLIMGITMFLQQKLNPAPTDPVQAKVFMFMPIIFTFLLAPFPAGLVIYWAWNNVLSIAQQWAIMRRQGVSASGGPAAGAAGGSSGGKAT
ncbi:MAG: membrane protein insertase YidC [Rhodospirillaceae bacterium]|nr:membrane protein insertase YidC [Rhodospirillaceae bacterium]